MKRYADTDKLIERIRKYWDFETIDEFPIPRPSDILKEIINMIDSENCANFYVGDDVSEYLTWCKDNNQQTTVAYHCPHCGAFMVDCGCKVKFQTKE